MPYTGKEGSVIATFEFSAEEKVFTRASVAAIVDSEDASNKVRDLLKGKGYTAYMLSVEGKKEYPEERSHVYDLAVDGVDKKHPNREVLRLFAVDTKTLSKEESKLKAESQTLVSKVITTWMNRLAKLEASESGEPTQTQLWEHKQADLIGKRISQIEARKKLASGYKLSDVLTPLRQAKKVLASAKPSD